MHAVQVPSPHRRRGRGRLGGKFAYDLYEEHITQTYDSLVITCDGDTVSSVSGNFIYAQISSDGSSSSDFVFKTEDGVLLDKVHSRSLTTSGMEVSSIIGYIMDDFDLDLSKAKDTGTTAAVGNVQAEVYTYSGTYKIFPSEYHVTDMKVYVYDGVAICTEGYSGDVRLSQSLTITHEE